MQQIFQNVIINRQELNSIEFEKDSIDIPLYPGEEQTFEILITNHGSPTHIHLSVSEELKGQITFLRDNPYVLQKEYISAVARIPQEGRILTKGQIYITAGYGSRKKGFPVQLGKVEPKPQGDLNADSSTQEIPEEIEAQKPSISQPVKKVSRINSGNGLGGIFSSFKSISGSSSSSAGKRTHKNLGGNENLPLTLALGGFILLASLFFLYFVLPPGLQLAVSFTQALLYSILFVICTTYILLKIME